MSKKIIITQMNFMEKDILLSGLLESDRLVGVRLEAADIYHSESRINLSDSILGNIYVGRVQRIVKNINAAFVEIAPGVSCYYPLEHQISPVFVKKTSSKPLVQNDEILVQVQKESVKTKAPTVSSNLTLTGRYVVLTTENRRIGVSGKFDKQTKAYYKEFISEHVSGKYGIIVRTNAKNTSDTDILAEIEDLNCQMDHMIEHAKMKTCFSCLYHASPKYLSYLQSSYQDNLDEIVTDTPEIYCELQTYCQKYSDLKEIPIRLYNDPMFSLANLYNLNKQLEHAVQKKVWLKSGGFLVIEPTEALTVIDVNTGKSASSGDSQKHFMDINLEASVEIAHQLRLRNISGIVIIDYIDMADKADQRVLLDELRRLVKTDPVPVQVHDITRLGLVEVTRKKVEKSLLEQLK